MPYLGWPNLSEAAARGHKPPPPPPPPRDATSSAAAGEQVERASWNLIALVALDLEDLKLEQARRKKQRALDPQRSLCLPIPAEPRESERGGRQVEQQELQEEEAGSRLHHFHRDHSSFFSNLPLAATAFSSEDAGFSERTGDHHGLSYSQLSLLQRPPPPAKTELGRSRHGGRGGRGKGFPMGEIVEVQGGHIMRSTGRKDRHSKVCTAKGPRDRRVRLSAPTAIQFYDVQDRLGFDRPSKAVDWLIKNAKAKIDELAKLPPWSPTATHTAATQAASSSRMPCSDQPSESEPGKEQIAIAVPVLASGRGGKKSTSFLPPSLDSDSIANTRKSFFPIAAAAPATWVASSPTVGSGSQVKDLRLSLQSLQDAIYHDPEPVHHNQHDGQFRQSPPPPAHNSHFQGNAQLAFAVTSADWDEQSQRIVPWNVVESGVSGIGGGGYMLSLPPPHAVPLHTVLGQNQLFSQGGPLQSSDAHTVRAWTNPTEAIAHHQFQAAFQPSMSSIGFAADGDLPGFRIPARFQGEEEHDGISDKPPSAA